MATASSLPPGVRLADRVRDLNRRIDALSERLTPGIMVGLDHHQQQQYQQQQQEPLLQQLAMISRRVSDLMAGRERLSDVASRLAALEPLITAVALTTVPGAGGEAAESAAMNELLLLQEDVLREEDVYYRQIKAMEHVGKKLTDAVGRVDGERLAAATLAAEQAAAEARKIRSETDALMSVYADMMKCMDSELSSWDKRLRSLKTK